MLGLPGQLEAVMGKGRNVQGCCVLLCSESHLLPLQTPEKIRERRKCEYVKRGKGTFVNSSVLAGCFTKKDPKVR